MSTVAVEAAVSEKWLEGLTPEQACYARVGLKWAKLFGLIEDEALTNLRTVLALSIIVEAAKHEVG